MTGRDPKDRSKRLDRVVAEAQRARRLREQGYRERALKLFPWICGRCGREFTRENLRELTVHHRDHDHDNNPPDGSNWELLCLFCHDNEHARFVSESGAEEARDGESTHRPFADLASLLKDHDQASGAGPRPGAPQGSGTNPPGKGSGVRRA